MFLKSHTFTTLFWHFFFNWAQVLLSFLTSFCSSMPLFYRPSDFVASRIQQSFGQKRAVRIELLYESLNSPKQATVVEHIEP